MSTPEEIEREREQLVELSEIMRKMAGAVRTYRAESMHGFSAALEEIRELNSTPAMLELERVARVSHPDYNPHIVEEALEAFIGRMSTELAASQRDAENTWLGIQESIIALDETGEVPSPTQSGPLLPDIPPRPGPDDVA